MSQFRQFAGKLKHRNFWIVRYQNANLHLFKYAIKTKRKTVALEDFQKIGKEYKTLQFLTKIS